MIVKAERSLCSQEISYSNGDNNNFSYFGIVQNFVSVCAQVPINFTNVDVFNPTYSFSNALFRLRYIQYSDWVKKIAQICSAT
jgi:hypothetical protein